MGCSFNPLPAIAFSNQSLPTAITRKPSTSILNPRAVAKELYFNHDGSATRKLLAGVNKVAEVIGVTLGPKEGMWCCRTIKIELDDPLENVGVKLVRQAGARTNDLAGDGCTTSIVLAQGLIAEGVKVIAAGLNPVQVSRGIDKTARALISELKLMSKEVEDHELADVAAVSAGNDYVLGNMIADALQQVGRWGVVTIEKGNYAENNLEIVEGMQFDRGYLSPYFVTDRQKMTVEFHDCKLLLVDKKITDPRELFKILDNAVKEKYPVVIVAEGIEQEALAPVIRNKLRGVLKAAAIKAPAFGERKSQYLEDIAVLTGVVITKDSTLIVTDGSTQEAVKNRVSQMQRLVENTVEKFQKKILNERIARLSGGIAILQVGAQTVVELKDKQLRAEDALNATKAAIEEGVVVGGGCCLLRLSTKIDSVRELFVDKFADWSRHFEKSFGISTRQIAKNAGVNGNTVINKILSSDDINFGYNAARDRYEDLMAAGILDPSKVVRCCLEHAASVAKTFLTADAVVIEIKEPVSKVLRKPIPTSVRVGLHGGGISLMIGLGLFAFIASILCSAAFFQNAKEIS
ncbi:UNVERIFIED_CONTAM: Chaperonin 60 subunit beta 4, chloroplastic [Sesamum calycinum]|uniref:Chaperonin 60 subunit beta 4, chloroplastic n=1 Tax=Sesamum calycinum TaxID=2727403 RepID=A0AAW2SXK2_9LAMI